MFCQYWFVMRCCLYKLVYRCYELQVGEITFFDLKAKFVTHIVYVSGCIDALQLAGLTDSTTFLLVSA